MPIDYGMLGIGALASATGVGATVLGSNLSYKKASRLMREQAALNYDYQTRWAKEGPSMNRTGLESAGYNPMLAVQNGTTGSNAGNFTSSTTANDTDLASPISSGLSNALAYGQLENQTAQTESNIKLNEAQGRSAVADAIGKEIHNEYLDDRERSELGKISAETTKLETDSAYNNALIQNLKDRLELDRTLGFMGIDTTRRGQNLLYNASTYASDQSYAASLYGSDTLKSISDKHSPSGRSMSFNNYMSGFHHGMSGIGEVLPYKFSRKAPDFSDYDDSYTTVRNKNETYTRHTRRHRK